MNMVERVTREILEADILWWHTRHPEVSEDEIREIAYEVQDNYIAVARAAIKAMREPTYKMTSAIPKQADASEAWEAMIDAALSE